MITPGIRQNYFKLRIQGFFNKSKRMQWKKSSRYNY